MHYCHGKSGKDLYIVPSIYVVSTCVMTSGEDFLREMGKKATFIPSACSAIEWGDLVSILLFFSMVSCLGAQDFFFCGTFIVDMP